MRRSSFSLMPPFPSHCLNRFLFLRKDSFSLRQKNRGLLGLTLVQFTSAASFSLTRISKRPLESESRCFCERQGASRQFLPVNYLRLPPCSSLSWSIATGSYARRMQPFTMPFQLFTSKGQNHSELRYQRIAFCGEDPARNHAEQLSMFACARRLTDHGNALARSVSRARFTMVCRVDLISS